MEPHKFPRSPHTCPVCHGTGRIDNGPYFLMRIDPCYGCDGTGRVLMESGIEFLEGYRKWRNDPQPKEKNYPERQFKLDPIRGEELLYFGNQPGNLKVVY